MSSSESDFEIDENSCLGYHRSIKGVLDATLCDKVCQ
jgi:hypothetical protein